MDEQWSGLTKLGLGVLACNSGLAIFNSWGDAGSVGFVLTADAALLLLFLCLGEFERRAGGGRGDTSIKAAVWALTTLLTAMFTYRVAPIMPVVVGSLFILCPREFERAQIGFAGKYYGLLKMGLGVVACNSALTDYHAHGDAGSVAFVLVAYLGLVIQACLFLRRFDGLARGARQQ